MIASGSAPRANDPLSPILNGPADLEALPRAYSQLGGARCHSPTCLAIRDVGTAFEIIEERHPPDAQTLLHPESFSAKAWVDDHNARLRRLLRSGRDRWRLECAILQKLANHYAEYSVGSYSIEVAGRISSPSFDCAATVIAALPDVPEVHDMLEEAAQVCELDGHPGCAFIDGALSARRAGIRKDR